MFIDFLLESFSANTDKDAIVWRDRVFSYGDLLAGVAQWRTFIHDSHISNGAVVGLHADFSPSSTCLLLALVEEGCIVVPLTDSVSFKEDEFLEISEAQQLISLDSEDKPELAVLRTEPPTNSLLRRLIGDGHPGLILFSSGSTGKSKAAVHDFAAILEKYRTPRPGKRMVSFLLFDHIGGVNTLLHTLANGGCIVTLSDRSPDAVCSAIEKWKVQVLPTSPTFVNLLILSEAYKRHDLSSLDTVTYGTEPMPESTLTTFHSLFPNLRLQQTYGLSEVGILRSKSRSSDSLWVKVGGEGFDTRIVDGMLEIKAKSAMLGYLNAPSPFTSDGWFQTGDMVEVDGEYLRFRGRRSEIINVGGEKVFPAEVESVIQGVSNVAEVTVYGERNAITGNIVCARITLSEPEDEKAFIKRLKQYCRERLQRFKVPVKVTIAHERQYSARYKKIRAAQEAGK